MRQEEIAMDVYASDNYKKGQGFFENWATYIALVNIARGEKLIEGQNVKKQGGKK